jgi:hypothetical protein
MAERGSGGGASLSMGALRREPGGRDPLLGDPGGQAEKALEMVIYFHRGPNGKPGRRLVYRGL